MKRFLKYFGLSLFIFFLIALLVTQPFLFAVLCGFTILIALWVLLDTSVGEVLAGIVAFGFIIMSFGMLGYFIFCVIKDFVYYVSTFF